MKNEVAKTIKTLVKECYKVVTTKDQIEIFDTECRIFNVNFYKAERYFQADVNGVSITDGQYWELPKMAMEEEVWFHIGRKLGLL